MKQEAQFSANVNLRRLNYTFVTGGAESEMLLDLLLVNYPLKYPTLRYGKPNIVSCDIPLNKHTRNTIIFV